MEISKNKERAENLTIYLVNVLSNIENNLVEDIDSIEEDKPLDKEYTDLFYKISSEVAKLLDEKLINHESEVIINSTIPKPGISTKENYSNFKRIDNAVDGRLSKSFKKGYAFLMGFNTDTYYGMASYPLDAFIAVKHEDVYGPIYLCACDSPDLIKYKEKDAAQAQKMIKKILK